MPRLRFASWLAPYALLVSCSSVGTPPDAAAPSDAQAIVEAASQDAPRPRDAAVDAFTRTPPPSCPVFAAPSPPACGTGRARVGLLPEDAALDARARRFDRGFVALHAQPTGVNAELTANDAAAKARLERFLLSDADDFAAFDGQPLESAVSFAKVAGAYAGAGAAADAFRYAVLRDEGAPCAEVDAARVQLHRALDGMHRAVAITGTPGVIARGYQRRDLPGFSTITVPLFDPSGMPLPAEKTNGTWRDDASGGLYPTYAWEDSCSRDMLIGWVLGMAAAWEVARGDTTIDAARLETLQRDATAIARSLMQVGASGRDLEIHDADGRVTYNGYLHESAIDRVYVAGFRDNGQHAIMALGIVAALARISDAPDIADWLHNDLIRRRDLPGISRDFADVVDFGPASNFSNYNMSFTGGWLAHRYLCDDEARAAVATAITDGLYATPGAPRQPVEMAQSFFDLVAISARGGATAWRGLPSARLDREALSRALGTLGAFPSPYWALPRTNCDAAELASLACVADDGTPLPLLGDVGRGGEVVAAVPVPMRLRPPSNFWWRSDPYRVNGDGDPNALFPAVDFRLAYWMARHLRAE